MNNVRLTLLFVGISVCFLFGCSSVNHKEEAKRFLSTFPEPVEIVRPTPEEWSLPNGMKVLFIKDDELPIVSGTLFIRGGTLHDSSKTRSVISTMGSMLRIGGAGDLGPSELDERLRELAAGIGSGFGAEYGTVSFNSLSTDFGDVFPLFSDVVLRPRFDEDRLEIVKTQSLESIRRRKDDPSGMSRITAHYLMYKKSPFGGLVDSSDVRKLKRLSLLRAHREFVRPDGAVLVVTGDISKAKVEEAAEKYFGSWEPRGALLGPPKGPPKPFPPGIYFIEGDYSQTNIHAVQPGPERHNPDRYGIRLLNNIVGDGLDSRLMKKIRADLGLAYSVYGVVSPGVFQGKNLIYIQTKSESTLQALEKAFDELALIQKEPPPEGELSLMQQAAQSSFIFRFTSPSQVLERKVILDFLGYPEDYDESYLQNIFAVTSEDINGVASRWWKLSDLRIAVVGNAGAIKLLREGAKNHPLLSQYPLYTMKFNELPKKVG